MSTALSWRSVARTHVGLVRSRNEDNFLDRPEAGLWAVADGMGGHADGERASRLIVERLGTVPTAEDPRAFLAAVRTALAEANASLCGGRGHDISGSTAVVLLAAGGRFACCWAGDSRLYRLRAGRLERLTHDHNLTGELLAGGEITEEEAFGHPLSNRITRALGIDSRLELDLVQGGMSPGDRYLLSSDGLHGSVRDAEIARLLQGADLAACADALIKAALDAGAPDNVTVVLVTVQGVDLDATLPPGA